jgi:glucose-6-phosphate 1-epimerase
MPEVAQTMPRLTHRAFGAQLLQACLGDATPVFYVNPLFQGARPVRGGVPLLFPQFADRGSLPKHGFVRTAPWVLQDDEAASGAHSLRYSLDIGVTDQPAWPHAARLDLVVELTAQALAVTLQVHNSGISDFSWSGGLHPYFALVDLLGSSLSGLGGLAVQDRYDADFCLQRADELHWTRQPCERLYAACPPLVLNAGSYRLELRASGFDEWMVWNPGEAESLADLPAGDWRRFVCVEPVCVSRPVPLAPGESFTGSLRVALLPTP